MNKIISKATLLFLILITTTSCMVSSFGIKGNGNVISEDRKISADFNEIKVSQGIQVYLTQGNKTNLNVETDENIMDLLVTEVEGNTLKIYFDKNVSKATRKVYLTTKEINSVNTSSGASVDGENTINTTTIALKSSSGSSIELAINADNIESTTSSGSNIKISGESSSITANASSGSTLNAYKLLAKNATASVSSGANLSIYANDNITVKASSGGNIKYFGNPKDVKISKSSGGSISKN